MRWLEEFLSILTTCAVLLFAGVAVVWGAVRVLWGEADADKFGAFITSELFLAPCLVALLSVSAAWAATRRKEEE